MHNIDKSFEKHFPNLAKEFKLKGFKLKDFQKELSIMCLKDITPYA